MGHTLATGFPVKGWKMSRHTNGAPASVAAMQAALRRRRSGGPAFPDVGASMVATMGERKGRHGVYNNIRRWEQPALAQ